MTCRTCAFLVLAAGLVASREGRGADAYGQPAIDVQAPGAPMPVLSDTATYCMELEHRIGAAPIRSAEVGRLVSKGHQLCDHGQVRRGVTYMRRALLMQRAERAEAPK